VLSALATCGLPGIAANDPEKTERRAVAVPNIVPLKLGASIPLSVQSAGVTWKGNTFHLVRLGSIRFDLDKSHRLKADIQAGVTEFDNVGYDISAAVFDAAGQMLGSARAQCKVQRMWAGGVERTGRTITLDFGVSLDYTRAAAFAVSVSNREVLTPDDWQKKETPASVSRSLQGDWVVVGMQDRGNKAEPEDLQGMRWIIKGDIITATNPDGSTGKMRYTIDPNASSRHFDITPLEGELKGKTDPGIYELREGQLRICYRQPDNSTGERPKAFTDADRVKSGSRNRFPHRP
jgi:uncharacterized protein (TIGR03067 family)